MTAGIGAQRADDERGWLVFDSLPDNLQRAEDSTQTADYDRQSWYRPGWRLEYDPIRQREVRAFYRPATDTERALLEHLGYTLPAVLHTRVQYLTETFRQRRWPQLESQTPTPEGDSA